ncbi:MAG: 16S rRNA (cytidine(1402)-2'-O)-methyltransferase [Paracoccus denitrificans]|nr:MAG: 16S rRNA (cytidine(1402)-2'-O)-methyltransferase [Paracoccus denitrificans]PZO84050.1 MAG: 16S rRNA (cytidine(1402)-2'-O)-methyltransferase [Paracoccus denitrificans]
MSTTSTSAPEDGAAPESGTLAAGLYLVATPIGNARDITLRALDILRDADVLAAEDTRRLRQLLAIHGVPLAGRRIIAHHDHNAAKSAGPIIAAIRDGKSVAYASDAGTPMIADPGYTLVDQAVAAGLPVHGIPGASAVLTALTIAGLPTDRFLFAGFPPAPMGQRRTWLSDVAKIAATVVLYESPRRVNETLGILCDIEPGRGIVLCRELTKRFEETLRGSVTDLLGRLQDVELKGEVVLILAPPAPVVIGDDDVRAALTRRLGHMSVKDAASEVAAELGVARKMAYQLAVEMGKDG